MSYDLSFDKKHAALLGVCTLVIAALLVAAGFLLGMNHASVSAQTEPPISLPARPASLSPVANGGESSPPAKTTSPVAPATLSPPAAKEKTPPSPQETAATTHAAFTLQFGAFKEKANAEALVKTLKEDGVTATVFMAPDNAGRTWYAVRSGTYTTMPEASTSADSLRATTHQSVLVRPAHTL